MVHVKALYLYRKKHLIFKYRIPLKCLPPCCSSSHFRPGAGQWYWHLDNRLLFSGVSLGKSVFLLQRLHLSALRPSGVLWVPVEVKTGEGLIETKEIMDIKANHSNGPVTLCPDLSLSLDMFIHIRDTLGCGGAQVRCLLSGFDLQRHAHQVPLFSLISASRFEICADRWWGLSCSQSSMLLHIEHRQWDIHPSSLQRRLATCRMK